jgi:HSP20 family protein
VKGSGTPSAAKSESTIRRVPTSTHWTQKEKGAMALPAKLFDIAPPSLYRRMDQVRRQLDDFDFFGFGGPMRTWPAIESEAWTPAIDMYEAEKALVIRVDLPGIDAKDVKVAATENTLTIQGERKQLKEKGENYYHHEVFYGTFVRRIGLPAGVKGEDIKATFKNGVLEVWVPKITMPQTMQIPVEAN